MLSTREGIKLSFGRVGELIEQGMVLWSSVIFKGPLNISYHEFKVSMAECFSPSSFIWKGSGT